ncbi:uncharacterized protein MELLADRAFT_113618 [Melampsora larici-populina 98AG31]|uniref:F-box domain-containing protein n=1 Tax=Melampsora larici-populina (strain 98AG31 / pathotype 3-4-7) TaxID=747676 RepID=F4SAH8_MELLP|nr:uncharacterized protein MELLADRAFT_113618 [Melampsora larici-populina 98AG31]EGF98328.1 hypothetical protein MELLADRAFT_113618 [Melampsora larici-populina 98AG31]
MIMKSSLSHPLFKFPTELWDLILSFIPNSLKSFTTHSLLIIFYQSEQQQSIISNNHLFHSINLTSHSQLKTLINSIQSTNHDFKTLPRTFSLKAWKLKDNHLFINLLNQISKNLRAIELNIGPLFGPDQLEEVFENEKSNLKVLSLRFNQNVSKRSYEPFLKGAYFDSTIDLISKWSAKSSSLRSFSFIQDPAPPPIKKKKMGEIDEGGIAQPIILFRFETLKTFTSSSIGNRIEDLRIRIPNRNLLPSLTQKLNNPSSKRLSRLKTLDLSTTSLNHQSVLTILRNYPSIEHLILDRTHLIVPVRFDADQERVTETLKNIGMSVATVGISRALDANRAWREVVEKIQVQRNLILMQHDRNRDQLRDSSHGNALSSGSSSGLNSRRNHTRVKKPGRSAFASGPMKQARLTSEPFPSVSQLTKTSIEIQETILPTKIVIIPSKPKLKTLSVGTSKVTQEVRNQWKEWFEESYRDGIEKYIKNVYEKIYEFERNLELWNSKKNKEEEENEERTKPLLLKFDDEDQSIDSNETEKSRFSQPILEFLNQFNLRITSIEEILKDLQPIEIRLDTQTLNIPIFCSIPDCKRLGKVVWDTDRREIDLIRIGQQLTKLKIEECVVEDQEVGKVMDVQDHDDDDDDELEKEDGEHLVGCGHFINRRIWDSEYW